MLDNDKYNQVLSPNISILVTNELGNNNQETLKQEKPKIFRSIDPFLATKNNNSNYRKCLSRLNLNEIRPDIKFPQSNTKELNFTTKLKKKSLYQLNNSSLCLNSDLKNKSSICLDNENKNLMPYFNSNSKYLHLKASNSNLYKSSNSLNALDLEIVDTFSIGSFDRYSFYSLYSINDLDNSDITCLDNSLDGKSRSIHLNAKNSQPLDKVKNWLEKI